jgi:hypothetical protein
MEPSERQRGKGKRQKKDLRHGWTPMNTDRKPLNKEQQLERNQGSREAGKYLALGNPRGNIKLHCKPFSPIAAREFA